MTQMAEADFVECTTMAKTRRHWALLPTRRTDLYPLCNTAPWGMSQHDVDMAMPLRWRVRKLIADLPECKQCAKSKQRRIDGRPA